MMLCIFTNWHQETTEKLNTFWLGIRGKLGTKLIRWSSNGGNMLLNISLLLLQFMFSAANSVSFLALSSMSSASLRFLYSTFRLLERYSKFVVKDRTKALSRETMFFFRVVCPFAFSRSQFDTVGSVSVSAENLTLSARERTWFATRALNLFLWLPVFRITQHYKPSALFLLILILSWKPRSIE